jgi:hypothetical protein
MSIVTEAGFTKLVAILEQVEIEKEFNVSLFVAGNTATANVEADATALGFNSHTETLGLTSTTVVEGVGSSSSSVAESVSLAQPNDLWPV